MNNNDNDSGKNFTQFTTEEIDKTALIILLSTAVLFKMHYDCFKSVAQLYFTGPFS